LCDRGSHNNLSGSTTQPELARKPHPPGVRITDKVVYAKETMLQYATDDDLVDMVYTRLEKTRQEREKLDATINKLEALVGRKKE
jgi:hypothetical protein